MGNKTQATHVVGKQSNTGAMPGNKVDKESSAASPIAMSHKMPDTAGSAPVDDGMALEIGRQVLSSLDSELADKTAYKASRYYIDRWLADLGSSAEETHPLSVNLLSKFDSFKMDQQSLWIKDQVPEEIANPESEKQGKSDGSHSGDDDDDSRSSDETSTFMGDDSVETGNDWESTQLDQRGYALVAVDALDTMCTKLAPTFPVLQEIRQALYPCLFLDNGESHKPTSNEAKKKEQLREAVDNEEALELIRKRHEPYTVRKFFFEGIQRRKSAPRR
jgi:hypothetical protein